MRFAKRHAAPPPPPVVEQRAPAFASRTLVTLAAATVVLVGIHLTAQVVSALALAMVFTVCAYPLRFALEKRGLNRAVAAVLVVVVVWAGLAGFAFLTVYAIIEFSQIVTKYGDDFAQWVTSFEAWLQTLGVGPEQIKSLLHGINPGSIAAFAAGLVGSFINFGTGLVFVFTFVMLLAIDVTSLRTLANSLQKNRPHFLRALEKFAKTSRRYLSITAIFGALTAAADGVVLVILGIDAPFLWVILAFITNFIPNIGFIIGLAPPTILALLANGWQSALLVIVFYSALNIAVQSFIQPLIVGHSVGIGQTLSFLSLILWTIVLGPIGAILAIPLTLFSRAILVEADPNANWIRPLLGDLSDEPDPPGQAKKVKRSRRARSKAQAAGAGS